ncbi:hypothetical protein ACFQ0I_17390, partial [Mariniflexile aquimaris]
SVNSPEASGLICSHISGQDIMKNLLFISLILFFSASTFGQDIKGQLFDLKTKEKIQLEQRDEMPKVWLFGNKKLKGFFVNSSGQFKIDLSDITELGDTIEFSINDFNINDFKNSFADFEFHNIPKNRLNEVLKEIYLTKAYWIPSCGSDCFTVNAKRTFKKKEILIKTSELEYTMHRNPEKVRRLELGAKYITDFKSDIIK